MTTADGYVIGATKIVDHGPASQRFNLVLVSEGYQAAQMAQFATDAQNFVNTFSTTKPYDDLWCAFNVYRVDVVSTDSGADDPAACSDGTTGSGVTRATYFDASFCNSGIRRLLEVNTTTVKTVVQGLVAQATMTLVIVNTTEYGGSGGEIAVFSLAPSADEIGLHEMGHTAFHFADEYPTWAGCGSGETGHNTYIGGEPAQPNVTIDANRATNKWRSLILATTAMPTMSNPDCTHCDTRPSVVVPGVVGAFEGADYYHCGAYRPEYDCRMNHLGQPFCAVCQATIREDLAVYMAPAVTLTTPSLSFTHIPEGVGGVGVTTYRAIMFDVSNCNPATLRIIAGPTGGFGAPLGTSVVVPASVTGVTTTARLWISYTSTHAGDTAPGSVTIQEAETGQTWTVTLAADTVARPKSAVVMVLDHTGSMSEDAGDGETKIQKLREAGSIFVTLMRQGDGIAIVRFNDTAQQLMAVTDAGPAPGGAGRTQANAIFTGPDLDPDGVTSIGAGVVQGKATLDAGQAAAAPPYDTLAMLALTDGEENTPPWIKDVASSLTANTFAIGFGVPANISTAALNALTSNHNGYLLITGTLTPDQQFRLSKYFLQIQAGITNAAIVLDPQGELTPGVEQAIPFNVTDADYGLDVVALSPAAGALNFRLRTPGGQIIDPGTPAGEPAVQLVTTARVAYYRMALPALSVSPDGSQGGQWEALLSINEQPVEIEHAAAARQSISLPYSLVVHSYSSLNLLASLVQTGLEPGAEAQLRATLTEYSVPVDHRATVWAEILAPDGATFTVSLPEGAAGQFAGSFPATLPGVYAVRVRATGLTFREQPFTREQTLTAVAYYGGDRDPSQTQDIQQIVDWLKRRDARLCRLLECLASLRPSGCAYWFRNLFGGGAYRRALAECLRAYCRDGD